MKLRTIKRLSAALLCVVMLAGIPALAASEDDALPSAPVGSETEAVVELPEVCEELPSTGESFGVQAQSMSAAVFNVTVPTTLPIHMDAYGNVTCGDIVITNNGIETVKVKDAQVTALNGWTLVDYATTTFTDANKGQHKVALQLRPLDGSIAANGGQKTIGAVAKIPYQGVKMTNASIAQVVFVLGVQAPDASIDWTYTLNGDTITLTRYIGESNDVVVRNKYSVGEKTYDKVELGTTEYVTGTIVVGPFVCSNSTSTLTSICFEEGVKLPSYSYLMFYNCSSLTSLDMSKVDSSNMTYMTDMFSGCDKLQTVTLGDKFSFNGATDARLTNLPTPNPAYIPGADGYWYTADGTRYAPSEIPNNTAATYYAVKPAPCDHAYGLWDRSNYPYWTRTCSKCGSVHTVEAPLGLCELRFQLETDSGTVSLGSDYYPISFSEMGWRDFYGIDISKFFNLALSEYHTTVTEWRQYRSNSSDNISDPSNTTLLISYENVNDDGTEYATIVLMGNSAGDPPEASAEWQYTTSGSTITLTKYIGSDTDVVMHNKYKADGKTYENVTFIEPPQVTDPPSARPFTNTVDGEGITSVTIEEGVKAPSSLSCGLNHHEKLAYADLSGLDTSNVTTTWAMFLYSPALTGLNLSGWNTSNVTNMGEMFNYCSSLTSLDVSGWNTSKVTDMSYMFSGCSSLVYLDLTGWDLSALSEKSKMFSGCTNLTSVYVKDQATKDKLDSGTDKPSTCAIIVAGIEITGNTSVNVGETIQLSVTKKLPPSVAENAVTWSTSNSNIATVNSSGLVTGVSAGTATITASCNGVTATHTVSVESQIPADFDEACDILFLVTGYNTDGTVSYEKTWCAYGMDYGGNRGGCGKYDSTLSDVVSESGTVQIKVIKCPSFLWFPSGWSFLTSYGSSCYKISEHGEGDWTNVTLTYHGGAFSGYVSFKASGGTTQP